MSLIGILLAVLLVCVIVWATTALLQCVQCRGPIRTVVIVVVVLLVLVWFLQHMGIGTSLLR